jgi:hypothetical protein
MKKTKKDLVEKHLNKLMESDRFSIDDLLEMTVEELAETPQLSDVGKITISTVLAGFKSKYEDDFFKDIDGELFSEIGGISSDEEDLINEKSPFSPEEIMALKKIIQEQAEKQNAELIELKLALKNAGIDYLMILKDYRTQKEIELGEWEKDISLDD